MCKININTYIIIYNYVRYSQKSKTFFVVIYFIFMNNADYFIFKIRIKYLNIPT